MRTSERPSKTLRVQFAASFVGVADVSPDEQAAATALHLVQRGDGMLLAFRVPVLREVVICPLACNAYRVD